MTVGLAHSIASEVAGHFHTRYRHCGAHAVGDARSRVRDGRAGEQILPASIWASNADDDDPITRSSGVFWDRICWRARGDGQKLLIPSKGLFHSAEFAPLGGSRNESFVVVNF